LCRQFRFQLGYLFFRCHGLILAGCAIPHLSSYSKAQGETVSTETSSEAARCSSENCSASIWATTSLNKENASELGTRRGQDWMGVQEKLHHIIVQESARQRYTVFGDSSSVRHTMPSCFLHSFTQHSLWHVKMLLSLLLILSYAFLAKIE
jgi:hypothetical protein